ncbi:hypothetical protein ACJJTC_018345 [Scirpophaga incertulas]
MIGITQIWHHRSCTAKAEGDVKRSTNRNVVAIRVIVTPCRSELHTKTSLYSKLEKFQLFFMIEWNLKNKTAASDLLMVLCGFPKQLSRRCSRKGRCVACGESRAADITAHRNF